MSNLRPSVTIQDLLRYALPVGTRLLTGREGLERTISWIVMLHTRPPAFSNLEGRELALLSLDALHLLSDKLSLTTIIHDLAQVEVAAIGVVGNIDSSARKAAEAHGIALLSLPDGTQLRQLERDCARLLVGTPPTAEERATAIHEQLLQLSTANRGLRALIGALADLSGMTVVVQDKRLDIIAAAGSLIESPQFASLESALRAESALPPHFVDRHQAAQHAADPALITMPEHGVQRLTVPIVANRLGRGFFSFLAEAHCAFEPLDHQLVRHGAAICALEMAKEKAIREAQKRVQGSLLERLLIGTIPLDQALRQLTRLGYQPNSKPYAALAACWTGENAPSDRRLETTFNEQVALLDSEALVQLMEGGVVVFCHAEPPQSAAAHKVMPRSVRQLAEAVLSRLRAQFPSAHVALGVGRAAESLAQWRASYQEAVAAQRIAAQWRVNQPLYFADLGVYRLLSLLLETPELLSFYRETLGELADESPSNQDFILTLETFFEEHGNLSQTASRLHVHRNTLLYRMERIAQLGGFDLDNPETRLAVHLALKIRRLLQG